MVIRRHLLDLMLVAAAATAAPCAAQEAISRAWTVRNVPDVPPGPLIAAISRPLTVRNVPDVPPGPVTEAISRSLTVRAGVVSGAVEEELPRVFALRGARPNPFNPLTTISFDVPRSARVFLRIYDLRGAVVAELLAGDVVPAGRREAVWDGRDLRGRAVAAGVYLCRMQAERFAATLPVTLVK